METHRHHLHNGSEKKIWHYFFEFFMLFLAVFCGFMAENFREHRVEKAREKVYMANMYADLKDDLINFSDYNRSTSEFLTTVDTLMILMKSPDKNSHLGKIFCLARVAGSNGEMIYELSDII